MSATAETAETPPSKRRRRRRRALLAVLAIPVLAVLALLLALRVQGFRRAVLDRVASLVEASTGVHLDATDFTLRIWPGRLDVQELELRAAAGVEPFLVVDQLTVEAAWTSFLSDRWLIQNVEVVRPTFDLGAPLPAAREKAEEETSQTTFELTALRLSEGRVLGDPAQLDPEAWLAGWRLDGLELNGSLIDEKLKIELSQGALHAERRGKDKPLAFDLRGALGGPLAGPYEVGSLELDGDGLRVEAMGELGLSEADPSRVSFELLVDAARLVPELTTSGRLAASGNLDPRALVGDVEATAEDFPAEILAPWMGGELLERMGLAGARLELTGGLVVEPETSDELQGQATLRWRRPAAEPIELDARVAGHGFRRGGKIDLSAMTAELELQVPRLPAELLTPWLGDATLAGMGLEGSYGELEAYGVIARETVQDLRGEATLRWRRPRAKPIEVMARTSGGRFGADGSFDFSAARVSVDLRGDGLRGELVEPWVSPELYEQLGAAGTHLDVRADLTLDHAATSQLAGRAGVTWRRGEEKLLTLAARAPERGAGGVALDVEADVLPGEPGERRLEARLVAKDFLQLAEAELRQSTLRLDLPELELAVERLAAHWPWLVAEEQLEPWPVRGAVRAEAQLSGPLTDPQTELELSWQLGDEGALTLTASGRPMAPSGRGELDATDLDLALINPWLQAAASESGEESPALLSGVLDAQLSFDGSPEDYRARLVVDGESWRYGDEMPVVDRVHLEAEGDPRELRLPVLTAASGESRVSGSGQVALERPLRAASLELALEQPVEGIEGLSVAARLDRGVLRLRIDDLVTFAGRGNLVAEVPLGALRALPGWEEALADQPVEMASGPLELSIDFPVVEMAEILAQLEIEDAPQNLQAALSGELSVDLSDPTALEGRLEIPFFTLATDEHHITAEDPLRFEVGSRRLEAQPFAVRADGQSFEVERARVVLLPDWRFGQDPVGLIDRLELIAGGRLPASLLTPYLAGGLAEGAIDIELEASGSLDRLVSDLRLRGSDASLTFVSPYLTRIEEPELVLHIEDGVVSWRDGKAALNEGELTTSGSYDETAGLNVEARLEQVRYRLNLGLSVVADGKLELKVDPAGRGRLGGELIIDRGVLRRQVDLDRELLSHLFAPAEGLREESALDLIELELALATREGVRVKNNLADLRVTWSPVRVRGTLEAPVLEGQLEVVPGGFVYAYGQTIRLDDATLTFPGDPNLEPDLDLVMTTSLDDPAVAREGARLFPVDLPSPGSASEESSGANPLAAGVVAHYGDQLVGRLGNILGGGTSVSFGRPVLIFSEADPSRRLTVTRDLSTHVALAASVALDTEGQQTYLLDLHDFRRLPRLITQVFTNDENHQGGALQQVLEFGGGSGEDASLPLLHELQVEAPEAIRGRGLRQAIGWSKGDRLPDGADFDSEVDVAEHLRRHGHPDARVTARIEPVGDGKADFHVAVDPGPHVDFEFSGDKPPSKLRPGITTLYRLGFYQETTLEEMRKETVRALQGEGYLDPRVELSVSPVEDGETPDDQKVVIEGFGGERIKWGAPTFEGVSDAVALEQLDEAFAGLLERVQLARGEAVADQRVTSLLERLGYPEARVVERRLAKERQQLTVVVAPGPRRQLREIHVEGVDAAEAQLLRAKISLASGQPARLDLIAGAALTLELDLRSRGYTEAQVGWKLEPSTAEDEVGRNLIFEVHDGPQVHIDDIRFTGLGATRAAWAERMTGLEKGAKLDPKSLARARRNLFNAKLFRSVLPVIDRPEDDRAVVTFDVEEGPRYSFAYGLRWESSEGEAVVFDVVDRNGFGRGVTLGLRGLYSDDDKSFRLYGALPRVLGTQADLELFVEGREFSDANDGLRTSRMESTLQIAIPLAEALKTRFYARYRDTYLSEIDPIFPDAPFTLRLLSPVLGWQIYYDSRDDAFDPSRGLFASADLSGAGRFIASDFSFVRFFGQLKHHWPFAELGRRRLTWAHSWRLGLAEAFAGQDLARPERFFAGGEYSVRGYDTDSVGPVDVLGDIVLTRGGEALLVVNQELRLEISERFRGLVFFDAGNVWDSIDDLDGGLVTSVGMGTRARTPIGLLRLDVAWPLDRRGDIDDEVKIYFGFGNTF